MTETPPETVPEPDPEDLAALAAMGTGTTGDASTGDEDTAVDPDDVVLDED